MGHGAEGKTASNRQQFFVGGMSFWLSAASCPLLAINSALSLEPLGFLDSDY